MDYKKILETEIKRSELIKFVLKDFDELEQIKDVHSLRISIIENIYITEEEYILPSGLNKYMQDFINILVNATLKKIGTRDIENLIPIYVGYVKTVAMWLNLNDFMRQSK